MKEPKTWSVEDSTLNIMLWGNEGVGKTYLTATMPKKIMYLVFDPNALNGINDHIVGGRLNPEDTPYISFDEGDYREVALAYRDPENPFGLNDIYNKQKFETLVIDSLTSWFKLAMTYAISLAKTYGLKESPTIERPQLVGYGIRNTATKEMAYNVVNWCRKHKINCVFIAHKGELQRDEQSGILYSSIGLSGDIASEIAKWCDECWHLGVDGTGKRILNVQPLANSRPLKTRVFQTDVNQVDATHLDLTKLINVWKSVGKINQSTLQDVLKG